MKDLRLLKRAKISGEIVMPVGFDRTGPVWNPDHIDEFVAQEIVRGNHMQRRATTMETDFQKAAETCDAAKQLFRTAMDGLIEQEQKAAEATKRASQNIRKAANEVHEGLQKLEKAADFAKIERYVVLLERSAAAMTALAELEKDGRLSKVLAAVR